MRVQDLKCPRCGHKGFSGSINYDGAMTVICRGCNANYSFKFVNGNETLVYIPKYEEAHCPKCEGHSVTFEYNLRTGEEKINCIACGKMPKK